MGEDAPAAGEAASDAGAKQTIKNNWHFHEVGTNFRHFPADLKLDNVEPEAFSKAGPDERAEISQQMNALLDRTRTRDEMFPDSRVTYLLGRMYFRVFADETELNFPNADNDLRALYQRFAYLFRTSYGHKVIIKRVIILGTIAVFSILLGLTSALCGAITSLSVLDGTIYGTLVIYPTCALLAYGLYLLVLGRVDQEFATALQQSCIAVSQNTLQRLAALKACIDNIQIAIRDSYDLDEGKWMAQSDYLMALTIWLPLRVLHIERYFQMTMWRVHRNYVYIQYGAAILQILLCVAVLAIVLCVGPHAIVGGLPGEILFILAVTTFGWFSFIGQSTTVEYIRDNIPIDQWKTFGELRMDTVISGVVGFLIKKFIMLRDVGRPNH
ncbi:hypothetical protein [Rhizomicrobium electricum]|uniref:Uncharacterized protein n=1 Tax=Rhizomicrobium electricum TaxID=480070 RepID=A0ABN1F6C4_9PROT|nr:hypothetical protein [Rhizomicrobium electricum]NIJ50436.1 hypothetical protein [Rhizomicrobium electricum]